MNWWQKDMQKIWEASSLRTLKLGVPNSRIAMYGTCTPHPKAHKTGANISNNPISHSGSLTISGNQTSNKPRTLGHITAASETTWGRTASATAATTIEQFIINSSKTSL